MNFKHEYVFPSLSTIIYLSNFLILFHAAEWQLKTERNINIVSRMYIVQEGLVV